jgi:hypothetical protein
MGSKLLVVSDENELLDARIEGRDNIYLSCLSCLLYQETTRFQSREQSTVLS